MSTAAPNSSMDSSDVTFYYSAANPAKFENFDLEGINRFFIIDIDLWLKETPQEKV